MLLLLVLPEFALPLRGGLLRRASIVAGAHVPIGKETDRGPEHGGDLSLLQIKRMAYRPAGTMVAADGALRTKIRACGVRALMRKTGLSHTLEAVLRGRRARRSTLRRLMSGLE